MHGQSNERVRVGYRELGRTQRGGIRTMCARRGGTGIVCVWRATQGELARLEAGGNIRKFGRGKGRSLLFYAELAGYGNIWVIGGRSWGRGRYPGRLGERDGTVGNGALECSISEGLVYSRMSALGVVAGVGVGGVASISASCRDLICPWILVGGIKRWLIGVGFKMSQCGPEQNQHCKAFIPKPMMNFSELRSLLD